MKERIVSQRMVTFYLCMITLVIVAFALIIFLSNNASADTHWWDGEGVDALFSTDANWNSTAGNDVEPTTGDNIYFWDWDDSCTWDVALTVGDISISANYTGTITQSAVDFGYFDFSMAGGQWDGIRTQWQNVSGNLLKTGGTVSDGLLCLNMIGTSKTITSDSALALFRLRISGTISTGATTDIYIHGVGWPDGSGLWIDSGKSLTLGGGTYYFRAYNGAWVFSNLGTINGVGTLQFIHYDADSSINIGVCNAPVIVILHAASAGSRTMSLGSDTVLGNTLSVQSSHASYTMTLNCAGRSLSATSITAGTRGIIMSSVVGARIDAGSIIVQTDGHIYGVNIEGIIYSDPILTVNNPNLYSYSATSNLTVKTWSKDSGNATWISVGSSNGTVYGTPPSVAYGHLEYFTLNIKLLDYMNDPFYQNYTITVNNLIPPPPDITSIPVLTVEQTYLYSYTLTANQTGGIWNFTSNATWLHLTLNILNGTDNNNGSYWVAITYINANGTGYQNYTLNVTGYVVIPPFVFNDEMILGLIFLIICFCISMVGYKTDIKLLPVIALVIALAVVVSMFSIFTGWTVYLVLLFLLVLGIIPLATWRK